MTTTWIIAGLLSVLAAAILARAVLKAEGKSGRGLALALIFGIPALSLGLYSALGRPDLQGHARTAEELNIARVRNNALLAQRPMELLQSDPDDIGALMALGEISRRFGHESEALKFYARALDAAGAKSDSRAAAVAEVLGRAQIEFNGGKVGPDAEQTFKYLLTLDPGNTVAWQFLSARSALDAASQHKNRN
jgi:cytochrome c-type biogenesis protein CcmH